MDYKDRPAQRSVAIHGANGAHTPGAQLAAAAYNGDTQQLQELLDLGYKVNAADRRTGRTALHEACVMGHEHVVRLLFEHGVNVHSRTMLGRESCLHLAALNNHDVICKLLLKRGIKPDRLNAQGLSPLHLTSTAACCYVLLDHGADPFVRSRDGESAMKTAQRKGHAEVYELLNEKLQIKMRKQSAVERERLKERREHYFKMRARARREREEEKKSEMMKTYLKFRWSGSVPRRRSVLRR